MKLAQAAQYIGSDVATLDKLEVVFGNVVQAVLALAAIALFIMLIVGGYKYITSAGDPKSAESAKGTLTYAIIGMVLVASAFLIIRVIGNVTGVNVNDFVIAP